MEEEEVQRRVQAVLDGEPENFAPLVHAFSPALFNLAAKMTGHRDEAAEIVQETFFRAYRDLGRFDGRARFQSWLYGICVNVCYDSGKRRRRMARHDSLEDVGELAQPAGAAQADAALVARQEEQQLRQCLARLPLSLRAALVLRFQEELPLAEVAQSLRIGLSAAKMRVARGLGLLRACMENGPVEEPR